MIGLRHGLAMGLWMAACMLTGHGQVLQEPSANQGGQAPPAFGVLDAGGFFNRNAGALKRIAGHIRQLEEKHGYMIYLVVEPVLIATSAPDRASELHQAWVPDGNGMVIVFESDSRNLGIGRDLVGQQLPTGNPSRIPSYETAALLTRAMEAADPTLAPDVYLEVLVEKMAAEFDAYFQRRATPPPAGRAMKIAFLAAGTLAILGLAAIGIGSLLRHPSMATVDRFRFPMANHPERLGAPCGGSVTARRFTPPAPRDG